VGGRKSANSRFFSFALGAFAFFALFFLRAFALLFCLRARERESAKKAPAPTSAFYMSYCKQAKWGRGGREAARRKNYFSFQRGRISTAKKVKKKISIEFRNTLSSNRFTRHSPKNVKILKL
jgi:hypothetical protein